MYDPRRHDTMAILSVANIITLDWKDYYLRYRILARALTNLCSIDRMFTLPFRQVESSLDLHDIIII